ncbi:hypothetical protein NW755_004742 [Fusarium falciforme]|uniref:Adenine DNA glycosylase n=1 Tax=Fusarium falciforme TaxID=195108 RepID=A0A9W8RCF4_9HYPO|nr:hypothetical protein NW755_004742 [Fusarium falciforme]
MLDDYSSRKALLDWFDGDHQPDGLRNLLERRAYEVWISEIMLQQTRVAVVIDYWNKWMTKWPSIHDLAAASADDVLSAWRGLGYYSRATRIHEASKLVVKDPAMKGLLPSCTQDLEAKVPGVGRYTAGAISAIVFGQAAPMVDGNVLRVLSRQLGLLGNVKTTKVVIDTLWAAADALVRAVARDETDTPDGEEVETSDRPGRWGQALMELGSTDSRDTKLNDIEDACHLCEPFEDAEEDAAQDVKSAKKTKANGSQGKQLTLASFAFKGPAIEKSSSNKVKSTLSARDMETIVDHARKFPLKVIKKAVREEETLVCVIRHSDGQYLVQKRPEKGLLAGLWEFPSYILQDSNEGNTSAKRKSKALAYLSKIGGEHGHKTSKAKHVGELGSVPWLFSHLKLTMHVHLFSLQDDDWLSDSESLKKSRLRWASSDEVDDESMGTGMRKCWSLVKDRDD